MTYTCNLTAAETLDELTEKIIEAYLDKPCAPDVEWIRKDDGNDMPLAQVQKFNKEIDTAFPYRQREYFDGQQSQDHWSRTLA